MPVLKSVPDPRSRRGNMILAVIFSMLVVFVGFGVLTHLVAHVRIQRARTEIKKDRNRLGEELLLYLHQFRETVVGEDFLAWPEPELDYFNPDRFPPVLRNRTVITSSFMHHRGEFPRYHHKRFIGTIKARDAASPQAVRAEAVFDLSTGHIPLTRIPLVLNKTVSGDPAAYLATNRIRVKGGDSPLVGEGVAEFDISRFLIDLLKIRGGEVNWRSLRERFGLEESDDAIDDGVYMVWEPPRLEAVFIQGDLQKLVFSVEDGCQVIRFDHKGTLFHLRYRPGDGDLSCWDDAIPRDAFFSEAVAVNGSVWSLSQEGSVAFLENSHITLYVAGRTVIHGPVTGPNVELQPLKTTGLTLVCGKNALPANDLPESRVIVTGGEDVSIQAAILVDGALENRSGRLQITGSLGAADIDNGGEIEITGAPAGNDLDGAFTTRYLSRITRFFVRSIEEVYGDD